jgi:hypothetical protein
MSASPCQLPPERRTRLARLLGMLGSNHAGEVANAGTMADKLVREAGLTWELVLGGITEQDPPPAHDPRGTTAPPWRKMAAKILAAGNLNDWERGFVEGLLERWHDDLTPKQQKVFDRLVRAYTARAP